MFCLVRFFLLAAAASAVLAAPSTSNPADMSITPAHNVARDNHPLPVPAISDEIVCLHETPLCCNMDKYGNVSECTTPNDLASLQAFRGACALLKGMTASCCTMKLVSSFRGLRIARVGFMLTTGV